MGVFYDYFSHLHLLKKTVKKKKQEQKPLSQKLITTPKFRVTYFLKIFQSNWARKVLF